jgi:uncharacterized protein
VIRRFRAGRAVLLLAVFGSVQFLVVFAMATCGAILRTIAGENMRDPAAMQQWMSGHGASLLLVPTLAAGVAVFLLGRVWARAAFRESGRAGLGWRRVPAVVIRTSAVAGAGSAVLFLLFVVTVLRGRADVAPGPTLALALSSPRALASFAVVAVVRAPPIEELLFRGFLLTGFSASFGRPRAALLVSVVFVLIHLPEAKHFPPAFLGIGLLALLTVWLRIRTGSLLPAIAAHAGYNAVIVTLVATSHSWS